jgi:hypothetical protein
MNGIMAADDSKFARWSIQNRAGIFPYLAKETGLRYEKESAKLLKADAMADKGT